VCLDCAIDWISIVGPSSHETPAFNDNLLKQGWDLSRVVRIMARQHTGDDLARPGIDRKVLLRPGSACAAVCLEWPFAPLEDLRAGAVDQKVGGSSGGRPAERRVLRLDVVWSGIRRLSREAGPAPDECLCLAPSHVKGEL
jgi:hypothetical protein